MLASLCVKTINKLFRDSGRKSLDDEQLFKTWQQIYHYFQSADFSTIQRIVVCHRFQYRFEEPNGDVEPIMMPLQIRMGILWLNRENTVQTIKFLQSIKEKDIATIAEDHCNYYLNCASMFPNLKVIQFRCASDNDLRCVSRECPLLEKVTCRGGVTDIGLDYLGDLTKIKDLNVRNQHLTVAGIVSFLKKSKTVLELFEYDQMYPQSDLCDAVDVLDSQNEVFPNMKYFECNKLSKLATVLKVFPYLRSLVVKIHGEPIDDFIKLQDTIKNNMTVKHLNIYGMRYIEGSDAYNLLRSLNRIFPQITSLAKSFVEDGELISYLDAEVDSSSSASSPFFRSVTCLNIECGYTTGMLRTCMFSFRTR